MKTLAPTMVLALGAPAHADLNLALVTSAAQAALSQVIKAKNLADHSIANRSRKLGEEIQLDPQEITALRLKLVENGKGFDLRKLGQLKAAKEIDGLGASLEMLWIKAGGVKAKFLLLPELQLDDPQVKPILEAYADERENFDAESVATRLKDLMEGTKQGISAEKQYALYLSWRGLLRQVRKVENLNLTKMPDFDLMQALFNRNVDAKATREAQRKFMLHVSGLDEKDKTKVASSLAMVQEWMRPTVHSLKTATAMHPLKAPKRSPVVLSSAVGNLIVRRLDRGIDAPVMATGTIAPTAEERSVAEELAQNTEEFGKRLTANLAAAVLETPGPNGQVFFQQATGPEADAARLDLAAMFEPLPPSTYLDLAAASDPTKGRRMVAAIGRGDGRGGFLLDIGDAGRASDEQLSANPVVAGGATSGAQGPVAGQTPTAGGSSEPTVLDLAKGPGQTASPSVGTSVPPLTAPTRWAFQNPDDALVAARARLNAGSQIGLGTSTNGDVFGTTPRTPVRPSVASVRPVTPATPPPAAEPRRTEPPKDESKLASGDSDKQPPGTPDGETNPSGKLGGRDFQDNIASRVLDNRPTSFGDVEPTTSPDLTALRQPKSDLSKQLQSLKFRGGKALSASGEDDESLAKAREVAVGMTPAQIAAARGLAMTTPSGGVSAVPQIVPQSAISASAPPAPAEAPTLVRAALSPVSTNGGAITVPPIGGSWLDPTTKAMLSQPVIATKSAVPVAKRKTAPVGPEGEVPSTVTVTEESETKYDRAGKVKFQQTTSVQKDRVTQKVVKTTKKTMKKLAQGSKLKEEVVETRDPKNPDILLRTETSLIVDKDENVVSSKVVLSVLSASGVLKTREERVLKGGEKGRLQVQVIITTYDETGAPLSVVRRLQPLDKGSDMALPTLGEIPVASAAASNLNVQ